MFKPNCFDTAKIGQQKIISVLNDWEHTLITASPATVFPTKYDNVFPTQEGHDVSYRTEQELDWDCWSKTLIRYQSILKFDLVLWNTSAEFQAMWG